MGRRKTRWSVKHTANGWSWQVAPNAVGYPYAEGVASDWYYARDAIALAIVAYENDVPLGPPIAEAAGGK